MAKNRSVIILGGTGIIGRELSIALMAKGYQVFVVSRGNRKVAKGVISIVADVYSDDDLLQKTKKITFDAVIDLVSFNTHQLQHMLDVFKDNCRQYVFVSSATVYDSSDGQKITENTPFIKSGWSYPLAKIACENFLKDICQKDNRDYTIIRPYITYSEQRLSFGIWEIADVWERLLNSENVVLSDVVASSKTTVTHAEDLAVATAELIGNPKALNEDFHITSDENITWEELYQIVIKLLKSDSKIIKCSHTKLTKVFPELAGKIADRSRDCVFDNTKFYQACPDFKQKYNTKNGYTNTIKHGINTSSKMINFINRGRMDRLAGRSSINRAKRRSLKFLAGYYVGFYMPWALPLARRVKRFLTGGVDGGYGV